MKKINLFLFSIALCISAAGQGDKQFILADKVNLKGYIGSDYSRIKIDTGEIRIADSLVSKYLIDNYKEYNYTRKIDNYDDYYRQYAGYKSSSPERIIFINAFLRSDESFSKQVLEENINDAKGGGSSFFKIKINLETKTCFDLRVNAPK